MAFERMKEIINSVVANRGPEAGKALELHAKAMLTIVHFEGYFKSIGDASKAQLADSLMDVVLEMGQAMGVTSQESHLIAEASAIDIANHPLAR